MTPFLEVVLVLKPFWCINITINTDISSIDREARHRSVCSHCLRGSLKPHLAISRVHQLLGIGRLEIQPFCSPAAGVPWTQEIRRQAFRSLRQRRNARSEALGMNAMR